MRTQRLIAERYSLVEPLPGSATGIGWRAQDLWSRQLVMITRVPVSDFTDHELARTRDQIAVEVRVVGGVQHDRLARVIDLVLDAGDPWVASELLPRVTVADELARRGTIGVGELARWGCDVADGLAAVHATGVTHRNLHAGVVGITEDGRAVVGGLATTVMTPEGLRSGTPVHVAPEVARGASLSPAADVFALGAMLYIAAAGHEPFPAVAGRNQLLPAVAAPGVAACRRAGRLDDLLMRMLNSDPAQRPTAAAVAEQLRQFIAASGPGDSATIRSAAPEPAGLDTCSVLNQTALAQVRGLEASQRFAGFAGWLCIWGDNPAFLDEPYVAVSVVRRPSLSGQPVQIGGRSAQDTAGGFDNVPGTCVVELVQRSFVGASGDQRVELLSFDVDLGAQQPTAAACRSATALAEAAVPKLPPAGNVERIAR